MFLEIFNEALQTYSLGEIEDEQFQGLLDELSSGCSHEDLYEAVCRYRSIGHPAIRPHMRRLEEIIYFLLEKGVVPSDRTIDIVCDRAYNGNDIHLLEELLKRYEGPLEKEFTVALNKPSAARLGSVVEVLYGFGIEVRIRFPMGVVVSPLEYFILVYAKGKWTECMVRRYIKEVIGLCPETNMDRLIDMFELLGGVRMSNLTKSYNIYEQVKNDLIQNV